MTARRSEGVDELLALVASGDIRFHLLQLGGIIPFLHFPEPASCPDCGVGKADFEMVEVG